MGEDEDRCEDGEELASRCEDGTQERAEGGDRHKDEVLKLIIIILLLRQGTLGRTWVSGPAHKFSVFGPTVIYIGECVCVCVCILPSVYTSPSVVRSGPNLAHTCRFT